MKNNDLKRYIRKLINDLEKKDCLLYTKLINRFNVDWIIDKTYEIIDELSVFGKITRRYRYPLCYNIIYGILNNCISFFSMNSNALIEGSYTLREKPQYKKITYISKELDKISKKVNIPIKFYSILPDYFDEFPFSKYDKMWEENLKYLENVSGVKAYRLSKLYFKSYDLKKEEVLSILNKEKLFNEIMYYKNNKYIKLGFWASADFQEKQIISYLVVGKILEEILPNFILIDIQKKNYPFEQKFYNYARDKKLPIIYSGQNY